MKRRWILLIFAVLVGAVAAIAFWPSRDRHAGYPLARRTAGLAADPLWQIPPDALERLTRDDAARLEQDLAQLDDAMRRASESKALLGAEKIEDLDADARKKVREVWWSILEPLLALDGLKSRYSSWFGVDYANYPGLHARSFALTFAALCAQVDAGQAFVELVAGKPLAQSLFDEASPELGLPAGTFRALRGKLGRSRDYSFVPVGAAWYDDWIVKHLIDGQAGERIAAVAHARRERALGRLDVRSTKQSLTNKMELLKGEAFARWFPVQKEVAEWFGDTRVAPEGRRLITDAQLGDLKAVLRPGDILVERRNWYLSNVGLPGFWPHAALYVGSQDDVKKALDGDPEVTKRFGTFSAHLAEKYPSAWRAFGERDGQGHPHAVLEAVSEGVVAASLEHSCGADYVAAMRPRLPPVEVARAIERALAFFGRPYDFNFDFATDDQLVCSELVMKAYEPAGEKAPGLRVPYVTVAGRRAIPPTELVRVFAKEREAAERQLDFVYFLDGREATKNAIVADATALAGSAGRPKWDIAQP